MFQRCYRNLTCNCAKFYFVDSRQKLIFQLSINSNCSKNNIFSSPRLSDPDTDDDGAAATDKQEAVKTNGTSNNPANINVSGDQINKD